MNIAQNFETMLRAVAKVVASAIPECLLDNQELGADGQDFAYPTADMQGSDTSWYGNHTILRSICKPVQNQSIGDGLIAKHNDESDHLCLQTLIFVPMGGEANQGVHVDGTDLLVFENEKGSKCYRVDTTVEDTIVVVLMNSSTQLHCGAAEGEKSVTEQTKPFYSLRFIHHC